MSEANQLPTIAHAGVLDDQTGTPPFLLTEDAGAQPHSGLYSCSYCGVGDNGRLTPRTVDSASSCGSDGVSTRGVLRVDVDGRTAELEATLSSNGVLEVETPGALAQAGGIFSGTFRSGETKQFVTATETGTSPGPQGKGLVQTFRLYRQADRISDSILKHTIPTSGCVKLKLSMMRQQAAFPIHTAPSVLHRPSGTRSSIAYPEAISRLADLLLAHKQPAGKTFVYACGQIDYFTIFAMQEVFRLLGIRNLTGNAEHCLNAGAVHNEILTGQEGPFVTVKHGLEGPNRVYLLNGWNGSVTHPPAFHAILKRPDLDAWLVDVMATESAMSLAQKLGPDRILLIRPASDPHLALAVAHEILTVYPDAVAAKFIDRFADAESFREFTALAASERFEPARVAERIAPEPMYVERLEKGIRSFAYRLTRPDSVPVNIPSVGLSQTSGVVAHCLWGSTLAMLGKYGLNADGTLAGGTLRLPGQINAESEVQGLSRKYFMGRIPMEQSADAARRMQLPDDAYGAVLEDEPVAALDYSEERPAGRELFLCFGTQFESNMMGRPKWISRLTSPKTTIIVVDPIPDPFSLRHADLIIPSPPHPATTKLYQNGEWKLSLSIPHKIAAPETRSDATIIYDAMAEISRRLYADPTLAAAYPELASHAVSGYLRERFMAEGGLPRIAGEVSRPVLWDRIQAYMSGGRGPLYCRPEHADGTRIEWRELMDKGSIVYGGVGETRYVLDYDKPGHQPFADVFRQPRRFRFFKPTERDLEMPTGFVLNSGRSSLSDDPKRIRFATSTFNSGKATPTVDMPDENPIHISEMLADRYKIQTGDRVRVSSRETGESIVLPAVVSNRVKGETAYVSFHKCKAEIEDGRYINSITSNRERCAYTAQTRVKATAARIECVQPVSEPARAAMAMAASAGVAFAPAVVDTCRIDPRRDLPVWQGQSTPLCVTEIIRETHDVYTYRFQGDPLCRFVYLPGQFCTLVLNIDGKKVVRSYSISSAPTRPFTLEITVKRVPGGLVSNWLADNVKVGDRIEISGPKGKFTLEPGKIPRKILFIGGGSGITPLMSMTRWLSDVAAPTDVVFFNSVRGPSDIIFHREIEYLTARHSALNTVIISSTREKSSAWSGLTGRISRPMLEMAVPDLHERNIFMCGPEGFMDAVKAILDEANFDLSRLHMESFGGVRTSVANKPAPLFFPGHDGGVASPRAAAAVVEPAEAIGPLDVEFAKTGKVAHTDGNSTLLELLEAQDIEFNYGCRAGSCGECKVKVLTGEIAMECEDGLDPEDKRSGHVLACVARPITACSLDA